MASCITTPPPVTTSKLEPIQIFGRGARVSVGTSVPVCSNPALAARLKEMLVNKDVLFTSGWEKETWAIVESQSNEELIRKVHIATGLMSDDYARQALKIMHCKE